MLGRRHGPQEIDRHRGDGNRDERASQQPGHDRQLCKFGSGGVYALDRAMTRRLFIAVAASLLLLAPSLVGRQASAAASSFATAVSTLSEREGYFDTDNLISNESSYLQVMPELKRR